MNTTGKQYQSITIGIYQHANTSVLSSYLLPNQLPFASFLSCFLPGPIIAGLTFTNANWSTNCDIFISCIHRNTFFGEINFAAVFAIYIIEIHLRPSIHHHKIMNHATELLLPLLLLWWSPKRSQLPAYHVTHSFVAQTYDRTLQSINSRYLPFTSAAATRSPWSFSIRIFCKIIISWPHHFTDALSDYNKCH